MARRRAKAPAGTRELPPMKPSPSGDREATDLWAMRYGATSARALYLHVPFCRGKCAYCDFRSFATRPGDDLMRRYVMALQHQMDHLGGIGLLDECSTAYVGGGTPSLLGPWLGWICETASRWCDLSELTCEANPDSLTDEVLRAMRANGVTRVSLGVQSLDDGELVELGRLHSAAQARDAVARAVEAGLDVSVDLMCGIPLQTQGSWLRALEDVLELGVRHVSVYPLQLEEGTPLEARVSHGKVRTPGDDETATLMELAESTLAGAGLIRYEVASYARPGRACTHNQAYWTGQPYLGLGIGAAGMLTRAMYQRLRRDMPQLPALPHDVERVRMTVRSGRGELVYHDERHTGALGEVRCDLEFLGMRQAVAEDLMLGARMAAGIAPALLEVAREVIGGDEVDLAVDSAVATGLATLAPDGSLVPTHEGWLRGNELYGALWGLAGEDPIRTARC